MFSLAHHYWEQKKMRLVGTPLPSDATGPTSILWDTIWVLSLIPASFSLHWFSSGKTAWDFPKAVEYGIMINIEWILIKLLVEGELETLTLEKSKSQHETGVEQDSESK